MPRVHHRKARKDYPEVGIKRGDMYYTWRIKQAYGGITRRSKNPPRPSELTLSEYLGTIGDLEQDLSAVECAEDLQPIIDALTELGESQDEKFENLPESLQSGPTGQTLEERRDKCQEAADELSERKTELEELESNGDVPDSDEDVCEEWQQQYDDKLEETHNTEISC